MDNPIFRFIRSVFAFLRSFIFSVGLIVVLGVVLLLFKSNFGLERKVYGPKDKIYLKMDRIMVRSIRTSLS